MQSQIQERQVAESEYCSNQLPHEQLLESLGGEVDGKKQKQHYKNHVDPRREWELAPLKEALDVFCRSNEAFQRPSSSFQPTMCRVPSSQQIPMININRQLLKTQATDKHSVLSLLEKYRFEKSSQTNGNIQIETRVGAQTQTDSDNVPPHELKSTEKSVSAVGVGQFGINESFPTYHSGSERNREPFMAAAKPSYSDESFPSYSSIGVESAAHSSFQVESCTTGNVGKLSACTPRKILQNSKGCAWVFDFNGDEKIAGDDENGRSHDAGNRFVEEKRSDTDTDADTHPRSNHSELESSESGDDEYDSTFLSED